VADGGLHASVGTFLACVAEEVAGPVRIAEKARVLPMGVASRESPELRASTPATLSHAPSRVGRRRGYLGLTAPQPPRRDESEHQREVMFAADPIFFRRDRRY
jgi:hypothetical protein